MKRIDYTSVGEEIFNSITHGLGAVLSVIGLIILIFLTIHEHDPWKLTAVGIYGTLLIFLYIISTLFHSLTYTKARKFFQILDESVIFVFIAGTYTAIVLADLREAIGFILLGLIWVLAAYGIVVKVIDLKKLNRLSLLLYLAMGWIGVIAIKPILSVIPGIGIIFLVAGGLCYTIGAIFYSLKKVPYMHGVWHLFVMTGSACHFFTILLL